MVWLGRADPVASISSLRSFDPARQARAAVFKAWAEDRLAGYRQAIEHEPSPEPETED